MSDTSRAVQVVLLVALSLTGTVYLLLLRYTRISTKEKYITTTTVFMQVCMIFFLEPRLSLFETPEPITFQICVLLVCISYIS